MECFGFPVLQGTLIAVRMIHTAKTRLIVLFQVIAMFFASAALAEPQTMTVEQANAAVQTGTLILLDVRTPGEWKETGVPKGAWPVNLRDKDFGKKLSAILDRNPDKKIGFICRTGNRSGYVFKAVQKYGVQNIVDVSEGMAGSAAGPGWLKAGLPTVSDKQALAALPADFTAK